MVILHGSEEEIKCVDYMGLGKRILQQRKLAKMTQAELAEQAGISLPFMGHIERGTRVPSVETLVGICNALKVSPQMLLQDSLNEYLLDMGTDAAMTDPQKSLVREISDLLFRYEDSIPRYGKKN